MGKAICNGLFHEDERVPEGSEIGNQHGVVDVGTDNGGKLIDLGHTGHRKQHMAHDIGPKFVQAESLSTGEAQ